MKTYVTVETKITPGLVVYFQPLQRTIIVVGSGRKDPRIQDPWNKRIDMLVVDRKGRMFTLFDEPNVGSFLGWEIIFEPEGRDKT